MEGPSLLIASEQLIIFKGEKVKIVSGNTKIGKERLLNQEVIDIFSWGKHLVFQFDAFAIRIHFLLFGTYEATINNILLTGDYQRTKEPRLEMDFENGNIKVFNGSIKIFETADLKSTYDFTQSIMSRQFDKKHALQKVKEQTNKTIDDVLLDQDIFAGVGNIIKSEVLFLAKIHPQMLVNHLSDTQLVDLIHITKKFSLQFYEWKKQFILRKNLQIYRKIICPLCEGKVIREKTGEKERWSYYCPIDQTLPN